MRNTTIGEEAPPLPDLEAIERSVRSAVQRVIRKYANDAEELTDLYQQVWLEIARNQSSYEGTAPIECWITAIARRVGSKYRRDANRRLRRHSRLLQAFPELGAPVPPSDCDPSVLGFDVNMDEVYDAVVSLPQRQRTVFLMRAYACLSIRDLSTRFGIAEGTVKATLAAARATIRERLQRVD